nr:MAG TPA: hypothetical protein [Caudoviricetes sp.]
MTFTPFFDTRTLVFCKHSIGETKTNSKKAG